MNVKKSELTVRKIAELAGVSVATVSRVINQNGRFSKETEQRIRKIMEENDFQPNGLAQGLRTSRAKVIGIIVPDITNEFFARLTLCIQRDLMTHQYMAIICNTDEDAATEQEHLNMLRSQRISGLIVAGQRLARVNSLEVPTVYIDRPLYDLQESNNNSCILIESDNRRGGYLAAKELLDKGCHNIAMVCFSKQLQSSRNARYQGFCDALQERGMAVKADHVIFKTDGLMETGELATAELLANDPSIDGIFYSTDMLAFGGIRLLMLRKISIPERIKVVGFDDISFSKIITPSLTTCSQNISELSQRAVECIIQLLENGTIETMPRKVDVHLVVRNST